jgi:serine/threonine protein kinase
VFQCPGDLKPENILRFGYNPQALPTLRVKLGDFGLAKVIAGTALGTIAGTETYMAPELTVRGRQAKQNVKVDIFSLGKVLRDASFYSAHLASHGGSRLSSCVRCSPPC